MRGDDVAFSGREEENEGDLTMGKKVRDEAGRFVVGCDDIIRTNGKMQRDGRWLGEVREDADEKTPFSLNQTRM